jgi:hypothetical protein
LICKRNKLGIAFVITLSIKKDSLIKLLNKATIMLNSFTLNHKTSKILSAVAVLSIFISTNLFAHDACDIELDTGFTLNETTLEFFNSSESAENKKQILYKINNDHSLIVHGQKIELNERQQALVTKYSTDIRAMVPQVRAIAIEGVDLALEGVNLAFNELLGEGNNVGAELTQELSTLRDEVATRFTAEHGITLGSNGINGKGFTGEEILGKEFEQRIESAVEKAVINSMGSLLMAMGQEMLFSDKESNSLETRMEDFGESIADEMEHRAEKIERKAEVLCAAITDIDKLEEQLKASISPLANINVISVTHNEKVDDKRMM